MNFNITDLRFEILDYTGNNISLFEEYNLTLEFGLDNIKDELAENISKNNNLLPISTLANSNEDNNKIKDDKINNKIDDNNKIKKPKKIFGFAY